jgi:SAM-dependent methyltransferase
VGYLGLGRRYNAWQYRVQRAVFRRMAPRLERSWIERDVLDVGAGTGFYVALWRELGARVTASDLTTIAVERLARRGIESVRLDIGAELPADFRARRFDAISAFAVLFHIIDDEAYARALINLGSLLRSGGWLLFSENCLHGPPRRSRAQVSRRLDNILALAAAADLQIIARVPQFVLMNAPIDARWPVFERMWRIGARGVSSSELVGEIAGAMLYPIERVLTRVGGGSPSTEFLVARKR